MDAGEDEVDVRSEALDSLRPDQPEAGPSRQKAPAQEGAHTPSRRRNTLQLDGHELDAFRMRNRPSWGVRLSYDEYDEGNEDAARERRIAEEDPQLDEELSRIRDEPYTQWSTPGPRIAAQMPSHLHPATDPRPGGRRRPRPSKPSGGGSATSTSSPVAIPTATMEHLDLSTTMSVSASASELFARVMPPPLSRHSTYSSLPPSPRLDAYDDKIGTVPLSGSLGAVTDHRELHNVLHRLQEDSALPEDSLDRSSTLLLSSSNNGKVRDEAFLQAHGVEEELEGDSEHEDHLEHFFPAMSRRATTDESLFAAHRASSPDEVNDEIDIGRGSPLQSDLDRERSPSPEVQISTSTGTRRGRIIEGLSLWELLKDEGEMEDWEDWVVDGKWERIANFLSVPLAVERVTLFGALLCLDGFLYNFTILPIRSFFAILRIFHKVVIGQTIMPIPRLHIHSILRMLLLVIPAIVLLAATDASKMYHTVRGQDTIKLYVIFNALEIADRLCCAFGQDVLDTLFAKDTLLPSQLKSGRGRKRQKARPYFFFGLSLGYVLVHTLIYFYMLVSLNVAINSYDYTLLSLLISNQFVEIKGSVFKKFEKENLFQILCADIVERFQLGLMLTVIAIRNMIEMAGSDVAFLPKSFIKGKSLFDSIASLIPLKPVLFVILSEMLVDWLKHAFITKFNHVRASVYGRFADVLAKDVLVAGNVGASQTRLKSRNHPLLLDQSPLVARRLGFASIPLAVLVVRIGVQAVGMLTTSRHRNDYVHGGYDSYQGSEMLWLVFKYAGAVLIGLSAWGCVVVLKVMLGLSLLSYSALRQAGMAEREAEDAVNDFGRAPVGESKEETEYNKQNSRYLSQSNDDLEEHAAPLARTRTTLSSSSSQDVTNSPLSAKSFSSSIRSALFAPEKQPLLFRDTRHPIGADCEDLRSEANDTPRPGRLATQGRLPGPPRDDAESPGPPGPPVPEKDVPPKGGPAPAGKKGKKWTLEEVERWTMVKRIW